MAASARTLVLLVLCFFLILTFYVPDTGSSRGGYRGGYRSGYRSGYRASRVRTRYASTRVRSGARVRVRQRVRMGTGGFSSSTWKAAALAGAIYGGSRYMRGSYYRQYPNRMPPICTNNYEMAPNGRVYGNFICPRENDPADANYCCGDSHREFCCRQTYYNTRSSGHHKSTSPWVFVGVVVVIIILVVVIVICCKRRHQQNGGVIFGKKPNPGSRTVYTVSEPHQVTVPLKVDPDDEPYNDMKASYQPPPQQMGEPQYAPPGPYPQGGQYPPPPGQYPPPDQYPPGGQYPPGPYPPTPQGGMPYPPAGAPPPYPDGPAPYPPPQPGMAPAYGGYGQPGSGYPPHPQ